MGKLSAFGWTNKWCLGLNLASSCDTSVIVRAYQSLNSLRPAKGTSFLFQILVEVPQALTPVRWGRKRFMTQQHQPALDQNDLCSDEHHLGAAHKMYLYTVWGGGGGGGADTLDRYSTLLPDAQFPSSNFIAMSLLPKHQYLCTFVCTASFLHLES